MRFYNVNKRTSVDIPESDCRKIAYRRETYKGIQERYAVRAIDDDGTNLTKFINKKTYDSLTNVKVFEYDTEPKRFGFLKKIMNMITGE